MLQQELEHTIKKSFKALGEKKSTPPVRLDQFSRLSNLSVLKTDACSLFLQQCGFGTKGWQIVTNHREFTSSLVGCTSDKGKN